ncbi:MAG TPA: DUF2254 domain-containing protein, partial [Erythrobacter sp.]|nr:DUF2254 domain-containing protein [Erythrobacter sp.]
MIARLRKFWHDINASYWFLPALFSIVCVALALGTIWLDRSGWADFLNDVDWL